MQLTWATAAAAAHALARRAQANTYWLKTNSECITKVSLEKLQSTTSNRDAIQAGPIEIDPSRRHVTLDGTEVDLTAREFDLLEYFARHPGRVFRRAELLDQVWGYGHEGYEHTVNSHINRLRSKIEGDPSQPEVIVTVWGVGYKFSEHAA